MKHRNAFPLGLLAGVLATPALAGQLPTCEHFDDGDPNSLNVGGSGCSVEFVPGLPGRAVSWHLTSLPVGPSVTAYDFEVVVDLRNLRMNGSGGSVRVLEVGGVNGSGRQRRWAIEVGGSPEYTHPVLQLVETAKETFGQAQWIQAIDLPASAPCMRVMGAWTRGVGGPHALALQFAALEGCDINDYFGPVQSMVFQGVGVLDRAHFGALGSSASAASEGTVTMEVLAR